MKAVLLELVEFRSRSELESESELGLELELDLYSYSKPVGGPVVGRGRGKGVMRRLGGDMVVVSV